MAISPRQHGVGRNSRPPKLQSNFSPRTPKRYRKPRSTRDQRARRFNNYTLPKIRIQLHCQVDGGGRWFDWSGVEKILSSTWEYAFIKFTCRDCGRYAKTYAVLTVRAKNDATDAEVMKLGEYPPFAAPISQRVEKLLGKHDLELYRKGMRAEAQALGIGAATYFRRIVDSQWKLLVTEIRDAAATRST